ncbi:SAM-dependent methyltransferase [Robbsia andropogonis]|uniref:SAM-dependent methyltransferase n=1 Tax=Robbsia andropogonis TaxID=28092 RepID=UPI000463FA93|nr:cyclopropane-fatty-acyl-phospholipid synthase family protein [Robbsia andropogonis]
MCATRYKSLEPRQVTLSREEDAGPSPRSRRGGLLQRVGTAVLQRLLARLEWGNLRVITPEGVVVAHSPASERYGEERKADTDADPQTPGAHATLVLHRWRMLLRLLRDGDIGFAESYIDGDWSSPDIAALIALAARNRDALDGTLSGTWWRRLADHRKHKRRENTRCGSRRNIAEHYDLGNAFYEAWLDASMCYSSGIYPCDVPPGQSADMRQTLEAAQARKLDEIERLLMLQGGESVLEIGCGWGALAIRLAQRGCHVVALTLSQAQFDETTARVMAAGLMDQVTVRLQDYRDVQGTFDRVVSIEMFEAVGETYWSTYYHALSRCLRPGGVAVLQVITIAESRFDAYRDDVDFIQRYVFPGGMLPAPSHLHSLGDAVSLPLLRERCFGLSYAATLAEWRKRFLDKWPVIRTMGFDERFRRLWEYYLAYCEGGFAAGAINVGLYQYRRGGAMPDGESVPTRAIDIIGTAG